jgi:hypothetical protein
LAPANSLALQNAAIAIARAAAGLQNCSGAAPKNLPSDSAAYGAKASSTVCEAPGIRSKAAIASLPPPVTANTIRLGAAWIRRTSCSSTIITGGPARSLFKDNLGGVTK